MQHKSEKKTEEKGNNFRILQCKHLKQNSHTLQTYDVNCHYFHGTRNDVELKVETKQRANKTKE